MMSNPLSALGQVLQAGTVYPVGQGLDNNLSASRSGRSDSLRYRPHHTANQLPCGDRHTSQLTQRNVKIYDSASSGAGSTLFYSHGEFDSMGDAASLLHQENPELPLCVYYPASIRHPSGTSAVTDIVSPSDLGAVSLLPRCSSETGVANEARSVIENSVDRPMLRPRIKPRMKLWEYLLNVLDDDADGSARWINRAEGLFVIYHSQCISGRWAALNRRGRCRKYSYDSFSRVLRYYIQGRVFPPPLLSKNSVSGERLGRMQYRFVTTHPFLKCVFGNA